jgi:Gpi18-like mannosyltransferase
MNISKTIEPLRAKFNQFYKYTIKHEWLLALILVVCVVIIGSFMGIENNKIVTLNPIQLVHYSLEPSNRLSFLANWDGVRYIQVAMHGYNTAFLTGFFPLYPLLIFLLDKIIGSFLLSALIISWACLFGAVYYYLKIIKLYFKVTDNIDALKATLLFVLFPSGVYLLAAYTESLFALLSLAAIYYALQKKYIKTAILAMLSTATHINGVFLVLLVAMILYEEKEKIRNIFITLVVGGLGLAVYMVHLWIKYHNPFEFITAQKDHHWLQGSILTKIGDFGAIDYLLALAILWTTIYWWKRRKSFAVYSGLYLLIPLVGGQFGGYPRYTLMVFPLQFMLFDYFRDKKFALMPSVVLIFFAIGWAYILLQFAAGYVVS